MGSRSYQGHAGQGGLQNHSIGGCYPYTVFGKETPHGLRYGVLNCATGKETGALYTCAYAWERASEAKQDSAKGLRQWWEVQNAD